MERPRTHVEFRLDPAKAGADRFALGSLCNPFRVGIARGMPVPGGEGILGYRISSTVY